MSSLPEDIVADLNNAPEIILLLDYDGTLVPLAPAPDQAIPDRELMALLSSLAIRSGTRVHLVSGRTREALSEWFGHLPISLWAEHAAYRRLAADPEWMPTVTLRTGWIGDIEPIVEQVPVETPGSFIERKSASLAWHYRGADPERGEQQAAALRARLKQALGDHPAEMLAGHKVIEVRMRDVSKAIVASHLRADGGGAAAILAIGDDWTDEDLFRALPRSSITLSVGRRHSCADYQVPDHVAVRELLRGFSSQK